MNFPPANPQPFRGELQGVRCIREMAIALVLVHSRVEFDDEAWEEICHKVAAETAEYYASPDDVQAALVTHEPTLATGTV